MSRHPEEAAVIRHLEGYTLEVGCGSNPTPGAHVTVDRTPRGHRGVAGSQEGELSRAGICAEMISLPFRPRAFQTLVARHTLEHHGDTLSVLREWARVAGKLVIVCPDQQRYPGNTINLDPTHRACFTRDQLALLAHHVFEQVWTAPCVPAWSFLLVAEGVRG